MNNYNKKKTKKTTTVDHSGNNAKESSVCKLLSGDCINSTIIFCSLVDYLQTYFMGNILFRSVLNKQ